jgi:hypothetical protein
MYPTLGAFLLLAFDAAVPHHCCSSSHVLFFLNFGVFFPHLSSVIPHNRCCAWFISTAAVICFNDVVLTSVAFVSNLWSFCSSTPELLILT